MIIIFILLVTTIISLAHACDVRRHNRQLFTEYQKTTKRLAEVAEERDKLRRELDLAAAKQLDGSLAVFYVKGGR